MRSVIATAAVAGVLAAGAALASAATAAADPAPPPPADPAAAPAPPPPPFDPAADPGPRSLASLAATPGGTPPDLLLSQYPVPSVAGAQPVMGFDSSVLNAANLLSSGDKLAEQGQQSLYSTGPNDNTAPASTWDAMKRAHGVWHMALGRLTPDQLGEPLDGTAPAPGTHLPPGVVDADSVPPPPLPLPVPLTPTPPPAG